MPKIKNADDLEEIDVKEEVKTEIESSGSIESHPDYDPSLPDNKQRDLR